MSKCLSWVGPSCCFPAALSRAAWLWMALLHVAKHFVCLLGSQPPTLASCTAAVPVPAVSHPQHRGCSHLGAEGERTSFQRWGLAECQVLTGGLAIPPRASAAQRKVRDRRTPQTWGLLPVSSAVSMEQNQIHC